MEAEKETALALLKEKAKELNLVGKKLKIVEAKFVEAHKLQKALVKDRETFTQFLQFVFKNDVAEEVIQGSEPEHFGLYDIT
jgi:cellobiose-specific phosphotransferase system component IIA